MSSMEKAEERKASKDKKQDPKRWDLEERTFRFAKEVRAFVARLPKTACNERDIPQLVDASGSLGANYIEANNALGRKDFVMHVRISCKESKEARYWLRLVETKNDGDLEKERQSLVQEASELARIFGAIVQKMAAP